MKEAYRRFEKNNDLRTVRPLRDGVVTFSTILLVGNLLKHSIPSMASLLLLGWLIASHLWRTGLRWAVRDSAESWANEIYLIHEPMAAIGDWTGLMGQAI